MDNNLSYADFAAMTNGNGTNMWNNPFMYLVWMTMFRNGGFGFGGDNCCWIIIVLILLCCCCGGNNGGCC